MKKILLIIIYFLAYVFYIQAQTLYGTTRNGGKNGTGTIIKLLPATKNLTVARSFESIENHPGSALTQAGDEMLYIIYESGGTLVYGIIFSFDPVTSIFI